MCLGPDIFIRYRCVPRGTILAGAILLGQVVRHSVFWCNDHHLVTEKSSTRQSPPKFHQAPTPPVQRHPHVTRKPKSASLHSSQEGRVTEHMPADNMGQTQRTNQSGHIVLRTLLPVNCFCFCSAWQIKFHVHSCM